MSFCGTVVVSVNVDGGGLVRTTTTREGEEPLEPT